MKNITWLIALISLITFSCNKDEETPTIIQPLLVKIVAKQGNDSVVTSITYNADKKVANVEQKESSGETTSSQVTWDDLFRIDRINFFYTPAGGTTTSMVYDFFYLTATDSKLRNAKTVIGSGDLPITDSIAYTYNGNKVLRTSHYYTQGSDPARLVYFYEYTFDGQGNMSEAKLYEALSGSTEPTLVGTFAFQYDGKVNPIYLPQDALVEYIEYQFICPANVSKIDFTGVDGAENFTANITYTYREDGRPLTATRIQNTDTLNLTYTYQN